MLTNPSTDEEVDDGTIERAPWDAVAPDFIDAWEQGQHFVTLGQTGSGKTTLAIDVLTRRVAQRRASGVIFVTKPRDPTISELGLPTIKKWPPSFQQRGGRSGTTLIVLWPNYTRASTNAKDMRPVFLHAIDEIMEEGNWTVYTDEASYLVQSMKLRTSIDELFTQSRSNGITLVAGSQRPVWVSRASVSQPTWVACFRINDLDDRRRAAEVLGSKERYMPALDELATHDFLLANTVTGEAVISRVGT